MYDCQCVRRLVAEKFRQLGADTPDASLETLLIRDGCYCGRRFECDGFSAVWFVEENQIKFTDLKGAVIQVVATSDVIDDGNQQAA